MMAMSDAVKTATERDMYGSYYIAVICFYLAVHIGNLLIDQCYKCKFLARKKCGRRCQAKSDCGKGCLKHLCCVSARFSLQEAYVHDQKLKKATRQV